MQKVTANRDGSIGPFENTTAAEDWRCCAGSPAKRARPRRGS